MHGSGFVTLRRARVLLHCSRLRGSYMAFTADIFPRLGTSNSYCRLGLHRLQDDESFNNLKLLHGHTFFVLVDSHTVLAGVSFKRPRYQFAHLIRCKGAFVHFPDGVTPAQMCRGALVSRIFREQGEDGIKIAAIPGIAVSFENRFRVSISANRLPPNLLFSCSRSGKSERKNRIAVTEFIPSTSGDHDELPSACFVGHGRRASAGGKRRLP